MTRDKRTKTGIWLLPLDLTQENLPHDNPTNKPTKQTENNFYAITYKQALIKLLYQCLFRPPKTTLNKACKIPNLQHGQV